MRSAFLGTLLSTAILPGLALAQPAPRSAPAPKPAAPAAPAAAQPAPPQIWPCRSESEICFLGVVANGQLAVIYTNAKNGEGIDSKLADLSGADGAKMDLAKDNGRVVMVVGSYDPKTGVKGEVVETASPLLSLAIKAQLGGGQEPAGRAAPARRR